MGTRTLLAIVASVCLTGIVSAQSTVAGRAGEGRATSTAPAKVILDVQTDRQDAMYHTGQKTTFAITVKRMGQPVTSGKVRYVLTNDGMGDLGSGELPLGEKPATVSGTLDKPGMLQCRVTFADDGETYTGLGAAACDPRKIKPSVAEPKDFDAFWKAQKAALAKIPLDVDVQLDATQSSESVKVYQVSLAAADNHRLHAWLSVPAKGGKHPAMVLPPDNGMKAVPPSDAAAWTQEGFIVAHCGMLDLLVDEKPEYYQDVRAPGAKYYQWGQGDCLKSRDTFPFRPLVLNMLRLVDYVTSRDDWDGKNVVIRGGSFSGGLSLMAAGLDERISAVWVVAPAYCEITGWLAGRPSCGARMEKDAEKSAAEIAASGYYDAVNFSKRIHCPTLFSFGLIDTTCPPTTVYSAFNVIPAKVKQTFTVPKKGHRSGQAEYWDSGYEFVMRHVGMPKKAK